MHPNITCINCNTGPVWAVDLICYEQVRNTEDIYEEALGSPIKGSIPVDCYLSKEMLAKKETGCSRYRCS